MTGLVIRNTGSHYTVRTSEGALCDCRIKGNFRLKGIRSTNPVAVGDRVTFEIAAGPDICDSANPSLRDSVIPSEGTMLPEGWITAIEDRSNYIIRRASNLSKQSHILAANVDQCLLIVTIDYPETSTTFIDRFLATAEAYRIPVHIVINKADRYDEGQLHIASLLTTLYESLGYPCHLISAIGDVSALLPVLKGKTTLLSGHSGVGKSTLINALIPEARQRTAAISDAHNTGMHTTTFSEMFLLPDETSRDERTPEADKTDGWIIDTPGIKGFGTFDMEREEVGHYFREIFRFSSDCRYANCTHTHEPGCAVLDALDKQLIAASRYNSYLSMLDDKDEGKYR